MSPLEMNALMSELTKEQHQIPAIQHALSVRSAMALNNYVRLFRLYRQTPAMGSYLMDAFLPRERQAALSVMCKAYRPNLRLAYLVQVLGFNSEADCRTFLETFNGGVVIGEDSRIDTKASMAAFA